MIYFLLCFEGFVGLAYQMLFIRQLTPEIGASAVSTSWIVGIFLLALAIGYKNGGVIIADPIKKLAKNFCLTALIGGVGAASFIVSIFFELSRDFLGSIGALIFYCMLFVAPVAYFMGQSLPLLIQRSKWGSKASELGGNALFLSTIGSFLGAVITTNVFYTWIGSTYTLLLLSLATLLVGSFYLGPKGRFGALLSVMLVFFCVMGNKFIFSDSYTTSTAYSDIMIHQVNDDRKILFANNGAMSIIGKQGKNKTWYLREYKRMLNKFNIRDSEILVLGAGGFVAHSVDTNNNDYTYVDIDPDLKEISENYFLNKPLDAKFVPMDARRFLIDSDKKHDVIFIDTFTSRMAIPSHLVTKEFFKLVSKRINDGGYLMINAILHPKFEDDYSATFHRTLISEFPYCNFKINTSEGDAVNVLYVCNKIKSKNKGVYLDESNKQEFDFWNKFENKY